MTFVAVSLDLTTETTMDGLGDIETRVLNMLELVPSPHNGPSPPVRLDPRPGPAVR
jgi:hypothetical protein